MGKAELNGTTAECRLLNGCNANLCPLDDDIMKRIWFIGEDVCNLPENRQLPMVRRQKWLNKHQPKGYMDSPLRSDWLTETARKKRELTEEEREVLRERIRVAREAKDAA